MKRFRLAVALRRSLEGSMADVRKSRFFVDRLSMTLLIGAAVVNGLNLMVLTLSVHPVDGQVPVQFSSLTLFNALGPWYFPFYILLYATGVTVANGFFAWHSYGRSRLSSFFLLVAADVVGVFSLIVSMALGAVR